MFNPILGIDEVIINDYAQLFLRFMDARKFMFVCENALHLQSDKVLHVRGPTEGLRPIDPASP